MSDQAVKLVFNYILIVIVLLVVISIMFFTISQSEDEVSAFSDSSNPLGNNLDVKEASLQCTYDGSSTVYNFDISEGRVISSEELNNIYIFAHLTDKTDGVENLYMLNRDEEAIKGNIKSSLEIVVNENSFSEIPDFKDLVTVSVWHTECIEEYVENDMISYSNLLNNCPESFIKTGNVEIEFDSACDSGIDINRCDNWVRTPNIELSSCVYENSARGLYIEVDETGMVGSNVALDIWLTNDIDVIIDRDENTFEDNKCYIRFKNIRVFQSDQEFNIDNRDVSEGLKNLLNLKDTENPEDHKVDLNDNQRFNIFLQINNNPILQNTICDDRGYWNTCNEEISGKEVVVDRRTMKCVYDNAQQASWKQI